MKVVLLHLSDIHIKGDSDPILEEHLSIARTLYSQLDNDTHVIILISGDIAFSGTEEQYNLASTFLKKIESHVKTERDVNIDFVICPGNHDCDFSANPTREFLLKSVLSEDIENIHKKILEDCTVHQKEYFNFRSRIEKKAIEEDKLWVTHQLNVGGKKITFESVNLSWASSLNEQQGNLSFPFSSYIDKSKLETDIRISVMHHPLNWLNQASYRDFRSSLRSISNFIITGHEHLGNVVNHDDIESGETIIIEGCVLQEGKDLKTSSFGIITLDLERDINLYHTFSYCPSSKMYKPSDEKKLLGLNGCNKKCFSFSKSYREKLNDCGGYFKHSNALNLKLSDVFVYPNIKKENSQKKKLASISSKSLLSLNKFSKGIILSGEENVGSTSLLYSLTQEYASQGLIPVLLKGSDIKQKHSHNIDLQIERALKEQFDSEDILLEFSQEPTCNKVLLIDDFDESKMRSESSRNEALDYLMSKFEYVIITVDGMYEVGELTSLDESTTTNSFDHYKIESFGYVKRTELINKWYSLGQQDNETEAEIIGKCNIAERLMDTVMDKSLISAHPIYLLTFLQSIESGQSSQLTDSALGHYYKFLLTESFLDVGVSADALGLEIDYAMHLARFFNERDTLVISLGEFKEFNQYFSDTWQETEFSKKEQTLLKAKVLIKNGNDYEFRYLYNYYYLLGMYLSQNILEPLIQEEIAHLIEHLYVKKYANTILFLAHHSSSDNILVMMKNAADSLFEDCIAADFNGGCSVANELIQHAPSLEFNKKSPQENRKELSERKEIVEENNPDGFFKDEEEDTNSLNLATKLTMLFKTIDILSQILKSNPSKFERPKKVEILKSIFSAPLRALQDFYNFLEAHPNALIEAINSDLSSKSSSLPNEEREAIARLAVSRIIQGVSSSFVIKTAQITNSDVLMPDIPTAISQNQTLAFELIDVAISLDNHKPLERRKIQSLSKKCKNNLVAQKALDIIILNRLHMFKTSEKDMQWLEGEFQYDLSQQHKIGYNRQSKLTKLTDK